jgi:hypothetical protein
MINDDGKYKIHITLDSKKTRVEWVFEINDRQTMMHRGDGPSIKSYYETSTKSHYFVYGHLFTNLHKAEMRGSISWREFMHNMNMEAHK